MENSSIVFAVVVGTLLLLVMVGIMGMLMVVNTNRRHKLAEAELRRESEILKAEREATEQTLSEVGRELHDNIGQLLTVAQMGLLNELEPVLPTNATLSTAIGALKESITEVRRLGRSLNHEHWNERRLADALRNDTERINRLGRVHATFVLEDAPSDPTGHTKIILFRTYQEVINNALKYSNADTLTIMLSGSERTTLTITDNGKGFDPSAIKKGSGLLNIKHRCALIGYDANLLTTIGNGCRWIFTPQDHGPQRSIGR